nr:putative ribonuclease H-like domain-containing protein [Tanacetum cinerariifolium]
MTGNKAYLLVYQDFNGGPVAFGHSKGQITGKGKIKTEKLDFEDVYFVKELQHFNLFSVSQICDKKNKVLFTDTECLILSPDFKLPDENQVLLRVPRQHNMYSFNLEYIVPSKGLACLIAKATVDESTKWHMSKVFRVYNLETKRVEENMHINFLENKPNVQGKGPTWLFDLDYLTDSMNYPPITIENNAKKIAGPKETNISAGTQDNLDAGNSKMKADHAQEYYVLPIAQKQRTEMLKSQEKEANDAAETLRKTFAQSIEDLLLQAGAARASSTNYVNTASIPVNAASIPLNIASTLVNAARINCLFSSHMRSLGEEHVSKQGEDKKAKTRLNIKEGNFIKLDDLVGEGDNYAVNKGRLTNKIKVLNVEAEGVSVAGKTLSTAILAMSLFSSHMRSLGDEHVSKQREDKKAKTGLNIKEGNFIKLDDLVGEGDNYAVNKGRLTNKIKVLNVEAEGVSVADKTLSTAILAMSTVCV